jgi:hypothetical protein
MRTFIKNNIQGRKILFLFIAANLIYSAMLLITIPKVTSFCGGMKLFDMSPSGYSIEYANSLLTALGEDGRRAYLFMQLPLDMVYPSLFGITYCLLTAYFLKKIGKLETYLFYVCCFPLAGGLFDYLENIGIIAMLSIYPVQPGFLILTASLFTILKSIFSTITFLVLIMVILFFGLNKMSSQNISDVTD